MRLNTFLSDWRGGVRRFTVPTFLLFLVACGGGGGSDSPPPVQPQAAPTSGTATGVITGFGSVVVDGVHYDDKQAKLSTENETGDDRVGAPSGLKIGQRAEIRFALSSGAAVASEIHVTPELVGVITSIDVASASFVVAGQTIKVNSDGALGVVTVFDGLASFAALKVGDRVEVHGLPQTGTSGTVILASRVEREPGAGIAVQVAGTISNLSTDGKQFLLGNTLVVLGASTKITPANTSLANGQRAKAFSRTALDNTNPAQPKLSADAIRIRGVSGDARSLMRLAGFITQWTSAADFMVDGIKVNASAEAAKLPASNQNGTFIRIQGTFDPASKVLTATSITLGRDLSGTMANELKGAITDFVALDSFKVRNTPVQVSGSTSYSNGTKDDLKNGAFVEIKGAIANGIFVATSIEFKTPENGNELELSGSIVSVDLANGTLSIQTREKAVAVKLASATVCDEGCTLADLKVGITIRVEGVLQDGVLVAREVKVMLSTPSEMSSGHADDGGMKMAEISGTVSALNSTSMTVNGKIISIVKAIVTGGDLAVGRVVEIKMAQQVSGEWVALLIKVKKD